jgi:hypothetical protein
MVIRFLNPVQAHEINPAVMAPRLTTLAGVKIGFLSNSKENADKLLEFIGEELKTRFPLSRMIFEKKMNAGANCPEYKLDKLVSDVDAVVTAIGD